jgi:hypothetical protein
MTSWSNHVDPVGSRHQHTGTSKSGRDIQVLYGTLNFYMGHSSFLQFFIWDDQVLYDRTMIFSLFGMAAQEKRK